MLAVELPRLGADPICDDCAFQHHPDVCSDALQPVVGQLRNELADYQVLIGGNRADFNVAPNVHEVPEFYCLDPELWHPDLEVPANFRLDLPASTVKIYHAVGNADNRSQAGTMRNIKSTHIYVPLIEELKRRGARRRADLLPRRPQPRAALLPGPGRHRRRHAHLGFFGATVREGMMLGKPVVCYLRPEWLDQIRREIPDYVDELPIVSATPETVTTCSST